MQSMFMFAIQSTCIVWLFSSLKIDTVGMATSPSTQHFHVLFIDDFRERHGSRRHSGVHHLDPFRPLVGQSMNPAVLWTVVSCICCWIVWEKLLIPLPCAVCVYRCRRGQIFAVFLWSADQVRSDPTRTIERQPISSSWAVYLWSIIDCTACFGERASSASIMSLESSMKRAPSHSANSALSPIYGRSQLLWGNYTVNLYAGVIVPSILDSSMSNTYPYVLSPLPELL